MLKRTLSTIFATPLLVLVFACTAESETASDTQQGSQTHFLAECDTTCDDGYSCLCGVCTVGCDQDGQCEARGGSCEAAPSDCSTERICDVACANNPDCSTLGSEFQCIAGRCREGAPDAEPTPSAEPTQGDATSATSEEPSATLSSLPPMGPPAQGGAPSSASGGAAGSTAVGGGGQAPSGGGAANGGAGGETLTPVNSGGSSSASTGGSSGAGSPNVEPSDAGGGMPSVEPNDADSGTPSGECADRSGACAAGEACVEFYVTAVTTTSWSACRPNPCGAEPTCDCADVAVLCTPPDTNSAFPCVGEPSGGLGPYAEIRCGVDGDCAAPDTPIATPEGDRPIASLRVGDLVYSVNDNALEVVPLKLISNKPVFNHQVVEVALASGAVLHISGDHPTADGGFFFELEAGALLDTERMVAVRWVPYVHSHTYDILPDSDSGTYVAAGVLVGSTLMTKKPQLQGVTP